MVMKRKSKISRREFAQNLGLTAAGLALLQPHSLLAAGVTPKQVEGPFYPDSDMGDTDLDLTLINGHTEPALGEHIFVHGQIRDPAGTHRSEFPGVGNCSGRCRRILPVQNHQIRCLPLVISG